MTFLQLIVFCDHKRGTDNFKWRVSEDYRDSTSMSGFDDCSSL